ncbi:MAG: hypothetical protein JXX28_19520 [Deltaproteobacteria bacterium]|nr:hypothetical protein [Deltaproteobacteria bacterium]
MRPTLGALIFYGATALAAEPTEGLDWRGQADAQTYYLESEVQLPGYLWLAAIQNKEARVPTWQLRAVLQCAPAVAEGKRAWSTLCTLQDVGLKAATMTSEAEVLPPILEEVDGHLTGAQVELVFGTDGRLKAVDLLGLSETNNRERRIQENLRLMVTRAVAGFDLQLPKKGKAPYGAWSQTGSVLMGSPSSVGTLGSSEFIHEVIALRGASAVVQTKGRGMVVPSGGADQFDTELESMSVFDTGAGRLTERVWVAVGNPTASSRQAEGGRGFMYRQQGKLLWIAPGEPIPDVGATELVAGPGVEGSALPAWQALGLIPVPEAP